MNLHTGYLILHISEREERKRVVKHSKLAPLPHGKSSIRVGLVKPDHVWSLFYRVWKKLSQTNMLFLNGAQKTLRICPPVFYEKKGLCKFRNAELFSTVTMLWLHAKNKTTTWVHESVTFKKNHTPPNKTTKNPEDHRPNNVLRTYFDIRYNNDRQADNIWREDQ